MKIKCTPKRLRELGAWLIDSAEDVEKWYKNPQSGEPYYEGVNCGFKRYEPKG